MGNKPGENWRQVRKVCININIKLENFVMLSKTQEQFRITAITFSKLGAETLAGQYGILDLDWAVGSGQVQFRPGNMDGCVEGVGLDNHGIKVFEICCSAGKTVGGRAGFPSKHNIAYNFCDFIITPESQDLLAY